MEEKRLSQGQAEPASGATARLDELLRLLVAAGGSDLLLVDGAPPCGLVEGRVKPLQDGFLEGDAIEKIVVPALSAHALAEHRANGIADSSYRIRGLGRFRINLHRQRGKSASAIRALPTAVPQLSDLNLPGSVESLARLQRGLVLIGGPAGSGKSTTLAALVNEINKNDARHIVTVEDPIEYEHQHIRSIVEQVEHRHGCARLPDRAARSTAAGSGRYRSRGDARSRKHAHRSGCRRDRASRAIDDSHHGCGDYACTHRGQFSCRAAERRAAGIGLGAHRHFDADPFTE